MEKCLVDVLKRLPENAVVKNVDVLFNPGYTVDVLKVLISAYKQKSFRLIWSGTYRDGKLIYSEEGYNEIISIRRYQAWLPEKDNYPESASWDINRSANAAWT